MDFIANYGLFLLKAMTIVVAVGAIIGLMVSAGRKNKPTASGTITVSNLNEQFEEMAASIKEAIIDEKTLKEEAKLKKKAEKAKKKQEKSSKNTESKETKNVYLIDFDGDMKASAVDQLREEISAILLTAKPIDEVVLTLESGGGLVHSYGLAASQLDRIRQHNIPLTICVDKVAASGGYMMACVANKICAAPFSIIGSIGVVAQLPNFHRLLKKNDIDFEMYTAGEYKRTLTVFGENTDKGREKFTEDLELTHQLFKDFVSQQRESVDIDSVATGEIWFGTDALKKNLIDEIVTSDDYIAKLAIDHPVYQVEYTTKKTLQEKMGISIQKGVEQAVMRLMTKFDSSRFFQ